MRHILLEINGYVVSFSSVLQAKNFIPFLVNTSDKIVSLNQEFSFFIAATAVDLALTYDHLT